MGVQALFLSAANILLKAGKIHSLIAFCKLFLSDIKVKILINSRQFLMVFFGCVLTLIDTFSFQ